MPEGACPDLLILPLYAAMPLELQVCCYAQCPLEPVSGASVPTGQWSCTQLPSGFHQTLRAMATYSALFLTFWLSCLGRLPSAFQIRLVHS